METKFQTSFIPKKPLSSSGNVPSSTHHGLASIFLIIAVVIFLGSIAGAGGAYFWKQQLMVKQVQYKNDLAQRQQQFNVDKIEQLKQLNVQISTAEQILANHIAVSQIFDIISRLTIDSVRFLNLEVTVPPLNDSSGNNGGPSDVQISLSGYASNLSSIAFQSDVLASLEQYGLRDIVKNPILSDPALAADKTVSFGFTATIDPSNLLYTKLVTGTSSAVTQ